MRASAPISGVLIGSGDVPTRLTPGSESVFAEGGNVADGCNCGEASLIGGDDLLGRFSGREALARRKALAG